MDDFIDRWACWLRGEKLDDGLQIDSGAKDSQAWSHSSF